MSQKTRILWFVPVPLPAVRIRCGVPQNEGGWWIESLFSALAETGNFDLGIVWSDHHVEECNFVDETGTQYYCVKEKSREASPLNLLCARNGSGFQREKILFGNFQKIIESFDPDIIHFHGSERYYGLLAGVLEVPSVLSIQGILSEYIKIYFGKLSLHRIVLMPRVVFGYLHMLVRSRREKRIFQLCRYFMGRTQWDKRIQSELNPGGIYFHCGELLRPEFWSAEWDPRRAIRDRLFCTTSCVPYKNIETLVDAVKLLKRNFPSITLRIAGNISTVSYGKYLRDYVKKKGLDKDVKYLGWLNSIDLARELCEAQAFVLPSLMENSPNSLAEAQVVGTPVIAANVGGIPSMIDNRSTGLLFKGGDSKNLSEQIRHLFEDEQLGVACSMNGRERARKQHAKSEVVKDLVHAYSSIIQERTRIS